MKLVGYGTVLVKVRMLEDPHGAAVIGILDIHRRVHAVLSCLVACGRDNTPLMRQSSDDQGLSS